MADEALLELLLGAAAGSARMAAVATEDIAGLRHHRGTVPASPRT